MKNKNKINLCSLASLFWCAITVYATCEQDRTVAFELNPNDTRGWVTVVEECAARRTVLDTTECDPLTSPGPYARQKSQCEVEECWDWMAETITYTLCEGYAGPCPPDEHNWISRGATYGRSGEYRVKDWITLNCTDIVPV